MTVKQCSYFSYTSLNSIPSGSIFDSVLLTLKLEAGLIFESFSSSSMMVAGTLSVDISLFLIILLLIVSFLCPYVHCFFLSADIVSARRKLLFMFEVLHSLLAPLLLQELFHLCPFLMCSVFL